MSDTAPKVYPAILNVMRALKQEGIGKSGRNQQQGYNFRGIDQVYEALCSALVDHNLLILPRAVGRVETSRPTKSGTLMFNVVLEVEFDIVSTEDGSHHLVRAFGEAQDSADKATNKASSAAYKYAVIQAFCIPVKGVPDADADSPEDTVAEPAPRPARNRRERSEDVDQQQESPESEPVKEAVKSERLNAVQQSEVTLLLERSKADTDAFLKYYEATSVADLKVSDFEAITSALTKKVIKLTQANEKVKGFKGVRK
jgi:hypothetical protein